MRAIAARDAGLALASQIKRWLLAGALTLTGLFSLLAAHAFRGHLRGTSAGAPAHGTAARASSQHSDDGGDATLQQPAAAPAPAPAAPAPVVSGGS